LSEGSSVRKGLADIILVEIGQFLDDLRCGHAVGNEIDDVSHRDSKAADGGSPAQDLRVVRDAIEVACHDFSFQPIL
jgi:hypothetical protein